MLRRAFLSWIPAAFAAPFVATPKAEFFDRMTADAVPPAPPAEPEESKSIANLPRDFITELRYRGMKTSVVQYSTETRLNEDGCTEVVLRMQIVGVEPNPR